MELGRGQAFAARVCAKNFANLSGELFPREWLLWEVFFEVENVVIDDRFSWVTGDEEEFCFRTADFQFLGQLSAAHLGHHDIGNGKGGWSSRVLSQRSGRPRSS